MRKRIRKRRENRIKELRNKNNRYDIYMSMLSPQKEIIGSKKTFKEASIYARELIKIVDTLKEAEVAIVDKDLQVVTRLISSEIGITIITDPLEECYKDYCISDSMN